MKFLEWVQLVGPAISELKWVRIQLGSTRFGRFIPSLDRFGRFGSADSLSPLDQFGQFRPVMRKLNPILGISSSIS